MQFLILLLLLWVSPAWATTYFVGKAGNNGNSCATAQSSTAANRKLTIANGLTCLTVAGDMLTIGDGTYAESLNSLPSGSTGTYMTVQAENDDGVIVTGGLDTTHTTQYVIVAGIDFRAVGTTKQLMGNHLKFLRDEFRYGCASGDCTNLTIGTNDFNDTADILIEDSWFHDAGGRYTILTYNATRIVLRRVLVRHGGGWTDTKGDPEAGITFYNTDQSACLDCIIIDSTGAFHNWQSAFYWVDNSASPHFTATDQCVGCLSLNNRQAGNADGASMRFDGNVAQTGHVITDFVGWDTNWCFNLSFQSSISVTINRATCGNLVRTGTGWGEGSGSSGTKTLTNLIIVNENTVDLSGASATFFDTFNNGSTSTGTGRVTYSPFTNGLLYLLQIEAGSALKTAGTSGGQIGPQIVNKIGISGTLFGETNYNTDTGTLLWPWPNEARIKKNLCTDAGVATGFCAATSLSTYIWQYLGNTCPSGMCTGGGPDVTPPGQVQNIFIS